LGVSSSASSTRSLKASNYTLNPEASLFKTGESTTPELSVLRDRVVPAKS